MTETDQKFAAMRDRIQVEWSEARSEKALTGLKVRRKRRAQTRAGVTALAVIALIVGGVRLTKKADQQASVAPSSSMAAPRELVASAVGGDAKSTITRTSETRFDLVRGRGHFEFPRAGAAKEVFVADARVEGEDAVFDVERSASEATVVVARGTVHIAFKIGSYDLHAGEARTFAIEQEPINAPPSSATSSATVIAPIKNARADDWRIAAHAGKFDEAQGLLEKAGQTSVRDEPEDLLLAADVARKSHHAKDAVAPLEKVLSAHASDSRAPMAAFTLGRVYLDELAAPRQALDAFRQAYEMAPNGPLAEDALAREVEAAAKAKDAPRAKERAQLYVRLFPNGARVDAVKQLGGLP